MGACPWRRLNGLSGAVFAAPARSPILTLTSPPPADASAAEARALMATIVALREQLEAARREGEQAAQAARTAAEVEILQLQAAIQEMRSVTDAARIAHQQDTQAAQL